MKFLATLLAIVLLALPASAHHRKGHQWDEYAEFRKSVHSCEALELMEKEYRWDITLFDVLGWGNPKEVNQKRELLEMTRDIKWHVCREI